MGTALQPSVCSLLYVLLTHCFFFLNASPFRLRPVAYSSFFILHSVTISPAVRGFPQCFPSSFSAMFKRPWRAANSRLRLGPGQS